MVGLSGLAVIQAPRIKFFTSENLPVVAAVGQSLEVAMRLVTIYESS